MIRSLKIIFSEMKGYLTNLKRKEEAKNQREKEWKEK